MNNPTDTAFLLYGAYGYTGKLITELASQKGIKLILAGRDEKKLASLAQIHQMPYEAFDLMDTQKLEETLQKVKLVLHCAGPFSATAQTMVNACLRKRVHYLDVTGEIDVFEWIAQQDAQAKEAGIVLMPGVGFDVVPSDCLALTLKNLLPDATHLELAICAINELSRGTALTMLENIHKGGRIRKYGQLQKVSATYQTKKVDFGKGFVNVVSVAWGDVATAYHSTQIPNIVVYFATDWKTWSMLQTSRFLGWFLGLNSVQSFLKNQIKHTVVGPKETHREQAKSLLWGEVRNARGETKSARLETPEGYKLTAQTALTSALRILENDTLKGYYTPSMAFGADFITRFEGVKLIL